MASKAPPGAAATHARAVIRTIDAEISRLKMFRSRDSKLRKTGMPRAGRNKRRLNSSGRLEGKNPKIPASARTTHMAWTSPGKRTYRTPRRGRSRERDGRGSRGRLAVGRRPRPQSARVLRKSTANPSFRPARPASITPKAWSRPPRYEFGVSAKPLSSQTG